MIIGAVLALLFVFLLQKRKLHLRSQWVYLSDILHYIVPVSSITFKTLLWYYQRLKVVKVIKIILIYFIEINGICIFQYNPFCYLKTKSWTGNFITRLMCYNFFLILSLFKLSDWRKNTLWKTLLTIRITDFPINSITQTRPKMKNTQKSNLTWWDLLL